MPSVEREREREKIVKCHHLTFIYCALCMPVFEQTIKVDFARCRDENIKLVEKHNLLVEDANDVRIRLKQAKVSFIPQTSRTPLQDPLL